jgi:outer membrane lipopolysaccharide assembly protein LptE/RlpB
MRLDSTLYRPAALLLLATLASTGCGYHISGQGDAMPKTMKILAVPPLRNTTPQPRLATLLTADITREFISRTRYTIVSDPLQADAMLTGTVTNYVSYPTILDPVSGRATGVELIVTMQLTLTDRHTNKVLFNKVGAEFRERYEVALDPQQYFDESGPAIQRVSRDVARTVVSTVLESF